MRHVVSSPRTAPPWVSTVRALALGALLVGLALASGCACTSALPQPATVAQPEEAFEPVPYPPPPPRPEWVPEAPAPDAVWVDGEWQFRRRWRWVYGRWVRPPEGAGFARSALRITEQGVLTYAPGSWRSAEGAVLQEPRALAVAAADGGDVVEDLGRNVDVGPNTNARRPDRKRRAQRAPDLTCKLDEACFFEGLSVPPAPPPRRRQDDAARNDP